MIDVVAALIEDGQGRMLLGRRSKSVKSYPGLWLCPGGKVEPNDLSHKDALYREIAEELSIAMRIERLLIVQELENDLGQPIRLEHFLCSTTMTPRPDPKEIDMIAWVHHLRALDYRLCPLERTAILERWCEIG